MERVTRDDVAVFVDFENVYVSVREKFDATPNFELIMDRCEDYGRIVIARAYADWYRYPRVTSALFANGVEPMYVPTYYYDRDMGRTGRPIKNSVDIHLCIDAMRTLYTEPNISKFVLVTGDRDFIPLVNAIRQRGKDVIIIGIGGAASAHLAQSADEFLFYEQIADLKATPQQAQPAAEEPRRVEERRERPERAERPERTRAERPPRTETAPPAAEPRTNGKTAEMAEAPSADRTPFDTLVDAIKLARQRGFVVNLGSLKVVMRELDSDFHESKVKDANGKGFSKFKDFVKEAER
ncbi:MAG TPA: NYN domain-containing protein, partial [Herpetosiphonaceae bacterium]|nr:NYN domain-containing protein [Herpetosiphonaceae bacterium]